MAYPVKRRAAMQDSEVVGVALQPRPTTRCAGPGHPGASARTAGAFATQSTSTRPAGLNSGSPDLERPSPRISRRRPCCLSANHFCGPQRSESWPEILSADARSGARHLLSDGRDLRTPSASADRRRDPGDREDRVSRGVSIRGCRAVAASNIRPVDHIGRPQANLDVCRAHADELVRRARAKGLSVSIR